MPMQSWEQDKVYCLKTGDTVPLKQQKQNKLSSNFHQELLRVTNVKGSQVSAEFMADRGKKNKRVTRDVSFFKQFEGGGMGKDH